MQYPFSRLSLALTSSMSDAISLPETPHNLYDQQKKGTEDHGKSSDVIQTEVEKRQKAPSLSLEVESTPNMRQQLMNFVVDVYQLIERAIKGLFMILFCMIVYVPFLYAVLFQSIKQKKAVDTNNWQNEVQKQSWLFGWGSFVTIVIAPFLLLYGVVAFTQKDHLEAVTASILTVYLVTFLLVDISTIYYIFLRKDLTKLRKLPFTKAVEGYTLETPVAVFCNLRNHFYRVSTTLFSSFSGCVLDPDDSSLYFASFYTAVAFIIAYSLLVGVFVAWELSVDHFLGAILFDMMAGVMYIMIASRLLSGLDCKSIDIDGEDTLVLDSDMDYQCWRNSHLSIASTAMICISFYASTAIFVSCYRGDTTRDGIRTRPMFLAIERTIKGIFACITTFFSEYSLVRGVTTICTISVLLFFTWKMKPSNLKASNHLRMISLSASLSCAIVYVIIVILNESSDATESVRVTMWYLLLAFWVFTIITAIYLLMKKNRSLLQPRILTQSYTTQTANGFLTSEDQPNQSA